MGVAQSHSHSSSTYSAPLDARDWTGYDFGAPHVHTGNGMGIRNAEPGSTRGWIVLGECTANPLLIFSLTLFILLLPRTCKWIKEYINASCIRKELIKTNSISISKGHWTFERRNAAQRARKSKVSDSDMPLKCWSLQANQERGNGYWREICWWKCDLSRVGQNQVPYRNYYLMVDGIVQLSWGLTDQN
jgi:hypothetical protein